MSSLSSLFPFSTWSSPQHDNAEQPSQEMPQEAVQHSNIEKIEKDDMSLMVRQQPGFLCRLQLQAKIPMPPDDVYNLLVAPENSRWFSSIKKVNQRKVLEDNRRGRQKVFVEQIGQWKFLRFHGEFSTKLIVEQDRHKRTVDFKLAEPGLMKDFAGLWRVEPYEELSQGGQTGTSKHQTRESWRWPGFGSSKASLVTLEQSILPGFLPPKPFDRLLKGVASKQIQTIMRDLRLEVDRRQRSAGMA